MISENKPCADVMTNWTIANIFTENAEGLGIVFDKVIKIFGSINIYICFQLKISSWFLALFIVLPCFSQDKNVLSTPAASTDMGNVSYVVPTIHPMYYIGTTDGNHTREFATASGNNGVFLVVRPFTFWIELFIHHNLLH